MKPFYLLALIALFIAVPFFGVEASSENNLRKTFKQLRRNSVWPVKGTSFDDIISPFGPRWFGRYDWHYGLDIQADQGTEVKAVKKGVVYDIIEDEAYGNTLILQHEFPANTKFKGRKMQYYYTWYLHLQKFSESLAQGQNVKKGQTVAYVGQTGNAGSAHLHLELRVGQVWSQQFNNAGYDSPVNPLFLFKPEKKSMALSLSDKLSVRYQSSDNQPLLNKVKLQIKDINKRKPHQIVKKYVLNLNHRTGFDASSITSLDSYNANKPYFSPPTTCLSADSYYMDIVIPEKYIEKYDSVRYRKVLRVYDIWGRSKKIKWQ